MRIRKTVLMVAVVIFAALLFVVALPLLASADSSTLDASGDNITASLKGLAGGHMGKAIFGVCLLIGSLCVMSQKTRVLGLGALAVGILLGAYSGLLDGLWTMFGGK